MNPTLVEVVTHRANAHIDPSLHIWGWEVPVYLFLGGVVAGVMVLTAALALRRGDRPASAALRWMPLVGVVALSLGMGALFLDLEYKRHVYRFYTSFEWTSPMSWGSWILLLVYPALLLFTVGNLTAARIEEANDYDRGDPAHDRAGLDDLQAPINGLETGFWVLGGAAVVALSAGAVLVWTSPTEAPRCFGSRRRAFTKRMTCSLTGCMPNTCCSNLSISFFRIDVTSSSRGALTSWV